MQNPAIDPQGHLSTSIFEEAQLDNPKPFGSSALEVGTYEELIPHAARSLRIPTWRLRV